MLLNTLQIALRNLLRNKVFSVINIAGLAAGIMCTIALFLYVADELSYDRYHDPANIYRAFIKLNLNGRESVSAKTASATGRALQQSFPEVTEYARIGYQGEHVLKYGDKIFRENNIYLADASYFSLLAAPLLYGDNATALSQPNSIVLTEASAKKYFGEENPIGKSFQVDEQTTWQVTGVLKDLGGKSHFSCDFLISMPEELKKDDGGHWFDLSFITYIKLKDGADIHDFEKKIQKKISENVAPEAEKMLGVPADKFLTAGNTYKLSFQPLSSVYLYSKRKYGIDPNTEWGNARTGDFAYVYIFSAAALFILLIAVMNFVNLSTARSVKRSKEVGIRKTLGSDQRALIGQFMVEAILITFISVVLSVILLQAALPFFNGLSGKDLHLNFANFYTIPSLVAFTFLVGTVAGSYPAFYLSSFKPVTALKAGLPKRKATLRSILVVAQFAISSILIIGVIAIRKQVDYIQNKDLGFKKEFLISIANGSVLAGREQTFKEELLKNPAISSVTNASLMFASGIPGSGYLIDKTIGADPLLFQYLDVDADFMKTFGLNLREGRFFSDKLSTDSQAVVINEAAARECNIINSPLDHKLTRLGSQSYRIIGVMEDFNYESLHQKVRPLVLHLNRVIQPASIFTIRVKSTELLSSVKYIENSWDKFAGKEKCYLLFLDQHLKRMYDSEKKTGTIVLIFSFMAVLIASLGLFGLTAFVTEQKTKEIGIRKVLGASVLGILVHISRQYVVLIILGNCLSWPLAWFIINRWFSGFAYHTDISIYIFVVSGLLVFFIAITTICLQALKAANADPVNSLRTE